MPRFETDFDPFEPSRATQGAQTEPASWDSLGEYNKLLTERLQAITGGADTYLPVEREHELAVLIQDGLAAANESASPDTLQLNRIQAGRDAERELIEANLRIAPFIARLSMNILPIAPHTPNYDAERRRYLAKYNGTHGKIWTPVDMTKYNWPYAVYDDRVQVLNEWLVILTRKFKPGYRHVSGKNSGELVRFSNYAIDTLKRQLVRYIQRYEAPGVATSVHVAQKVSVAQHYTPDELNVTQQAYEQMQELDIMRRPMPIDFLYSLAGDTEEADGEEAYALPLAEVWADPSGDTVHDAAMRDMRRQAIEEALQHMSTHKNGERTVKCLRLYFGLTPERRQLTLEQIGQQLDPILTREWVRRIIFRGLDKLRQVGALEPYYDVGYAPELPPYTLGNDRITTTRAMGAGAVRLLRDIPDDMQPFELPDPWETVEQPPAPEPLRTAPYTRLQQLFEQASPVLFAPSPVGVLYPAALAATIRAELGNSLTLSDCVRFIETDYVDFRQHLTENYHVDPVRADALLAHLITERMDESSKLVVWVPAELNGRLSFMGMGLSKGELTVYGDLGDYAGYQMHGRSKLTIVGSAGDYAGAHMADNAQLAVRGSVGQYTGQDATGGTIVTQT